jgi:hypothetical protein
MRPLFLLGDTQKSDPAVERWLNVAPGDLGVLARQWFEVLSNCGNDVEETLHDYQPTVCVQGAAFAYIDIYKAHINIGFFQGADLPDPQKLLSGTGKYMRHVKVIPEHSINTKAMTALINAAYTDVKQRLGTH